MENTWTTIFSISFSFKYFSPMHTILGIMALVLTSDLRRKDMTLLILNMAAAPSSHDEHLDLYKPCICF